MYIDTFTCSSCEEDKPIDEFYTNNTLRGHYSTCKSCVKLTTKKNNTPNSNTRVVRKWYDHDYVFRGDPFPKPRIIKPRKHYAP
jgi:hypothetical protein